MKYNKQYTCLIAALLLTEGSQVSASRFIPGGVEQFDDFFAARHPPTNTANAHRQSLLQQRSASMAGTRTVPDIERDLDVLASKEPMLKALEDKIPQMNKMEETLQHISHGLDHLVDEADMNAAQEGRETIKRIYQIHDDKELSSENKKTLEDMEYIKGKQKVAEVKAKSEVDEAVERYKEQFAGKSTVAVRSQPPAPRPYEGPSAMPFANPYVRPLQYSAPAPIYAPEPRDPHFGGTQHPYMPVPEPAVGAPAFDQESFHGGKAGPSPSTLSPLALDKVSAYTATGKSKLMPARAPPAAPAVVDQDASASPPSPPYPWLDSIPSPLQAPMPTRTADHAAVGAGMDQLTTAPELPAPLINPDWSINQERSDPAVLQFQRDLDSYKAHVKEFMAAKAKADTASSADAGEAVPQQSQEEAGGAAQAEGPKPAATQSSFMASRVVSGQQMKEGHESPFAGRVEGQQRDPQTGWTKNQAKLMAPMPARSGTEPILFNVPGETFTGPIATSIRDKVEGLYKGEADQKKAKAEEEVELVKEAMEFARNVGTAE